MKKKLSLLMVAFLSVMAFAATLTWKAPDTASEVTLDFTAEAQGYTNGQAVESLSVDDVTASFAKGSSSNAPKYYSTGDALRCYGGNTIALTSEKTITKAVFTFASGEGTNEITADKGTFETDTWTGSENAVTFTIGGSTGHRRIQKIVVTLSGEAAAVAKPVISGETPFLGTTNVTITCATEGAAIYYTTDGTAPTAESTAYTEPFAINATTTVKAIAVKDADQSEVAEKTFTAMEGTATLAELNALENGATFGYTGEAKVVAKPTANHVYVTDASGAALIYDASGAKTEAAEVGKTIAANWTGKVSIYNQLTELVPDAALVMKDGDAVAVEYPEVAATDMIAENVNRVVTLKGITGYVVDGKNMTITIGETPVVGYNQFGLEIAAAEEGKTYEMVGAISRYKENIQFQPISIARTPDVLDVTVDAADITGDITAALNAKTTAITEVGDIVGNITINLEAGAYTVSAPIVAGGNVVINGNGATIDASELTAPFIQLSAEPIAAFLPKNDGSGNTDYYGIDKVDINNVKVTGLKQSIFWDSNKKYCVVDFKIDNCVFALATEAVQNEALIAFQAGGAKDFTVKNSTISGNNAVAKYFLRYNNGARIDRYGFLQATDTWSFTYENNTFYGLLNSDGQWGNYNGLTQKTSQFVLTINNNIWVDCDAQTMRRLNHSKNFSAFNAASAMANNVFNREGAVVDQGSYSNGSDLKGVVTFTDAANGDFNGTFGTETAPTTETTAVGDTEWTLTNKQVPANITIGATELEAAANDISAALATAATGKIVGNLTVNLAAGGAYTVTAPIEAGGSVVINGAEGATIDASSLTAPFIQLSAEPTAAFLPKNDGSGNTDYYGIDKVDINNVKVTGLKQSIFWDSNKKYCVVDFKIDNCVFALATEAVQNEALIAFQAGGAKDFTVKNSTISGNNAVAKYFVRYNNAARIDRYGFLQATDTWSFTYENNTFYGLLNSDGQWGNYNGLTQKTSQFVLTINNNIWVDCDAQTMRRLNHSKNFSAFNAASAMANNVFNREGAVVDQGNYGNGSDLKGVVTFTDAANGDFNGECQLAEGAVAPEGKIGDTDWNITFKEYVEPVMYIFGDVTETGWNSVTTKMTFNKEASAFEYDINATSDVYFAFSDTEFAQTKDNWTAVNASRYSLGTPDAEPTIGVAMDLVKGMDCSIKLPAGTWKVSITADMKKMTVTGEAAPAPTVEKLYIMGTGTPSEWSNTTEMTFNEATQAFEYEVTNNDKLYITFGDAEFTNFDDWNANNRIAIALGNQDAPVGTEFDLIKVGGEGTLVLEAGSYKISVTKTLKCTITTTTGINAVKADALKDAQIYTISGQRVDKAQKGLYIVNGKKVVVK